MNSLPPIAGELIGAAVAILAVIAGAWLNRRRRRMRNERPPQVAKLLRPAGYSLHVRYEQGQEKWNDVCLVIVPSAVIFCVTVIPLIQLASLLAMYGRQLSAEQMWKVTGLLIFTAFATVGSAAAFFVYLSRLFRLVDEMRYCGLGMRGEQAVAEALIDRAIVAAGYETFNDVPGDGPWNIDHIVVGPAGVFVIETKARSRRTATINQEEHVVRFDGQTLQFPWCRDSNVVPQVQRNVEWVCKFIRDFCPDGLQVHAVIAVPGWYVESTGNFAIKAMNANYLVSFLTSQKPRFTGDQLRALRRRFDERCRTIEF